MAVPKAAVNKNQLAPPLENQIRLSEYPPIM